MRIRFDKLGVVIAAIAAYAAFLDPFATFRANRIVPGEARSILEALPAISGRCCWQSSLLARSSRC